MPADTKHKDFEKYQETYQKIRDCKAGESAVKIAGEAYLPKLTGQKPAAYERYIARGSFYNAMGRTVNALTGLVMRKEPMFEVPKEIEDDLENITSNNLSIIELTRECIEAALSYARQGLLVDADNTGKKVFIAVYDAMSIINWRMQVIDGEEKLTMLVLQETCSKIDDKDKFVTKDIPQVRVLQLEGEDQEGVIPGKLIVKVYQKKEQSSNWEQVGEDMMPNIQNKRLDYIPFVFIGAMANEISPEKPPLADLATLNIGHWRMEVDYKHGLHLCAIPTPWAAGFPKNAELYIGPEKAWVTEEIGATCGYLEFTGQGLSAIKEALERAEQHMATMGSRVLEQQKKSQEAFATVKSRQGSDSATLENIAGTVEKGLEKALTLYSLWKGRGDVEIEVTLNRDFVDVELNPQQLTAMLAAVQAGKMSTDSFLWNLKRGELISPDKSIEDELSEIELEREMNGFDEEEEEDNLTPEEKAAADKKKADDEAKKKGDKV